MPARGWTSCPRSIRSRHPDRRATANAPRSVPDPVATILLSWRSQLDADRTPPWRREFRVLPLVTLRVTGLEPQYLDPASEAFASSGRTARPGLWLTGEVVREPVTDWDWVREVNHPVRGSSVMLETHTWYGIPHSVTIGLTPRGDKLYIRGTEQGARLDRGFPDSKAWWTNVMRDPRVRMKIDGKIYEMTVVLVTDRAEVAEIMGRDPIRTEIGPDGSEQVVSVAHYFRVFQRNVREYGSGAATASSSP